MKRTPGPPKKPSALEELQGRPGKRARNEQEPDAPALETLEPPVPLTPAARAVWERDAPIAQGMRTLTRADLTAFVTYCRLQALGDTFAAAAEAALAKGASKKSRTPKPNPALWAAVKTWEKAQALAGRFGLNPSDRSRIKVPKHDAQRDPLEAIRAQARAARAAHLHAV